MERTREEPGKEPVESDEPASALKVTISPASASAAASLRCPYCHDTFPATKPLSVCASCLARHHAACWRTHGKCATCSATEELVPRSTVARPRDGKRAVLGLSAALVLVTLALVASLLRSARVAELDERAHTLDGRVTMLAAALKEARTETVKAAYDSAEAERRIKSLEATLAAAKRGSGNAADLEVEIAKLKAEKQNNAIALQQSFFMALIEAGRAEGERESERIASLDTAKQAEARGKSAERASGLEKRAASYLQSSGRKPLAPEAWIGVASSLTLAECYYRLAHDYKAEARCSLALIGLRNGRSPADVLEDLKKTD